jgi:heme/copper-type cytochrome/quinol oxidase subunit 3
MTHAQATADMMRPPTPAEPGAGVYSTKLGMWVFLASDIMFFTALIGTYIILRFSTTEAWAQPGAVLNVPLTAFNTFLLICSSVSMVKAFAAVADGDQKGLKFWLLMTILGGAAFVGVQVFGYIKLADHGLLPSGFREGSDVGQHAALDPVKYGLATSGLYGSTFYSMTGFHGFHVTCGVVCMTWVLFKAMLGGYTQLDYRGVEVIGLYWHFVDLVWIILFTIVYLI